MVVVNDPLFAHQHLYNILRTIASNKNAEVILVSSSISLDKYNFPSSIKYRSIYIVRNPDLFKDLIALLQIISIVISFRPSITLSFTHKAAFITSIILPFFPFSTHVHTFTGQVWPNMRGIKRRLFCLMDSIISFSSDLALTDSVSQTDYLNKYLYFGKNTIPLKPGSLSGIDLKKFYVNENRDDSIKNNIKYIYLGRINKAKGIKDIIEIAPIHFKKFPKDSITVIGPCEDKQIKNSLVNISNIYPHNFFIMDFITNPEHYLRLSDILLLPSRREGFGNIIIEAAACGNPTIAYNIYGVKDAVINNKTGLLATPFVLSDFRRLMEHCSTNKTMLKELTHQAISYSLKFDQKIRTKAFIEAIKKYTSINLNPRRSGYL